MGKKHEIDIDFKQGIIYRTTKNQRIQVGNMSEKGYMRFKLNGKMIYNHRYIYEQFHNCKLKEGEFINHRNHIRNDNRIENLQRVSLQQNNQYVSIAHSNSGYKNIIYRKNMRKYQVYINIFNLKKHIGYYDTLDEAIWMRNEIIDFLNKNYNYMYLKIDETDTNVLFNTFFMDLRE